MKPRPFRTWCRHHAHRQTHRAVPVLLRVPGLWGPPHIHVQRERMVAKFWLDPVALQKAGGFKAKELNKIAKLVQEYRDEFLEQWYEFFGR